MPFYCHHFVGVHSFQSENVCQKDSKHYYRKKQINFKIKNKSVSVELSSIEIYVTVISQFWSKGSKICQIPVVPTGVWLGCILNSHIFSV